MNVISFIHPRDFYDKIVPPETILDWFKLCDAIWKYDYQSPKPGYHAELKSKLHSDGFLLAPEVLKHYNLRQILARQFFLRRPEIFKAYFVPDYVVGIPKTAKELGRDTADFFSAYFARLEKRDDGSMELIDKIPPNKSCLIVEDICTKGTGFREAVAAIEKKSPDAYIVPWEFVIVNRGNLKEIRFEDPGRSFQVMALVEYRINEWEPGPDTCSLCKRGSIPIKPKATPENWEMIKNGQK